MSTRKASKTSILIVADELRDLLALEAALQSLGHRIALAEGAASGLKLADQIGFGLVLLNANMRGVEGLDFVARLRRRGRAIRIPVILVAPHQDQPAHELDAVEYIDTPVDPEILRARVQRLLAFSGRRRPRI